MQQLDRLAWADGFSLVSYGLRIGLRANTPGGLNDFVPLLPPGWKPDASPEVDRLYSIIGGGPARRANVRLYNIVYANAFRLAREQDLHKALELFEQDLPWWVAEFSPDYVFVHAGVVAIAGQAIVIPGATLSGKTSLVAALVKAGATYYSDEYAVLDAQGRVHPYARPLRIREHGPTEKSTPVDIAVLGGRAGTAPLPVGMVLVSTYKPTGRWRPRALSPGEGALALLANTVSARSAPARAVATLGKVVTHAPVVQSARGEAAAVVDFVLRSVSMLDNSCRSGGASAPSTASNRV